MFDHGEDILVIWFAWAIPFSPPNRKELIQLLEGLKKNLRVMDARDEDTRANL